MKFLCCASQILLIKHIRLHLIGYSERVTPGCLLFLLGSSDLLGYTKILTAPSQKNLHCFLAVKKSQCVIFNPIQQSFKSEKRGNLHFDI